MAAGLDPDYLRDLFAAFGPVDIRRMFGGAGLFVGGQMFGLVAGGVIHLKAGPDTIPDFEREGCAPFSYATKAGTHTLTSYWRLPERLYDDPDELAQWARAALRFASQKAAAKPSKAKAARKPKRSAATGKSAAMKTARKAPA